MLFKDRTAAGKRLAEQLATYADRPDLLVLALPRGGVPVAFEVAKALNADLDVILVRKLGMPGQQELAMGAIAWGGVRVLNEGVIRRSQISESALEEVAAKEQQELARREQLYRNNRPLYNVHDRVVILIDDGLATGATMRAAIQALRLQQPSQIIVAVPIAATITCQQLVAEADQMICVESIDRLSSIGYWYENFAQTSDAEVCRLLEQSSQLRKIQL